MKKSRFFIPFALIGLVLTGCANASALVDNFSEGDRAIETPWEEYVMPASGLEFAEGEESIELNKGDTHTYSYTIQPRGATANSINWFSNNQNIVSVADGVVTAVGGGETTILASSIEGTFDAVELAVKVNVPLQDFSLDVPARLDWNERYEFDVTYVPEDTTYRELTYEIVNPSAEGVALLDGEAVTTGGANGSATLRVSAGNISHDYPLVIETIPVTGIALSSSAYEVEVRHGIQVNATVSPSDASDFVRRGVKFYSRNPDIATVDEASGVVTGVSAGEAHIFARVGSFESASDLVITVYEVHATSVVIDTPAFTLANHGDGASLEKQLEWTITTDKAGVNQPSNATITFASDDVSVATVSDSGLVTATGPGAANISINIAQEGRALVTASVAVTVNLVSTALTISGGTSFYNDESLTLTATLVPANVSNDEITWTLEPATGVASLSATTGASVTLLPADEDATGTVVVTATNTGGASNSVTITVAERTAEFTTGHHYIVGNNLYNTGESVHHATKTSWNSAKYAYHFTNRVNNTASLEEYKGTIKFAAGDEFRYRVGGYGEDGNGWVPAWEQQEGWAERGYHIENSGAFADGSMKYVKDNADSDAADANVYVVEAGWYDLYAKLYRNDDGSTWYSLYIQKVPQISVELPELTMGPTDTYQIEAHDYIGAVTYESNATDIAIVSVTGLITAVAVGTATITVKDSRNSQATVTVHVKDGASGVSKVIYLHANGLLDQGEPQAIPFVYSWKQVGDSASNATSVKMTKVAGQTLIYEAEIPVEQNYVIFVNSKLANFDWEQKHQQTVDLAIPEGKDMFKPTGTEDEKVVGEWLVFDPDTTYTIDPVEINAPYIFYTTGGSWVRKQLVTNPGNSAEVMGSVDLPANGEFCVCLTDTTWLHFENIKDGSASQVVAGAANDDGTHNFKASAEGTYTLYVDKDSHLVYVAFEGNVPDPDPEVIKLYFADDLGWVEGPNTPKAYVWGGSYGSKADWPGEDMTYVGLDVNSKKVYSYDVDVAKYNNIIFFCGGKQTVDIAFTSASNNAGYKATTVAHDAVYNVTDYTYVPQSATTYTVSFNSNGGSGDMADATGISGAYTLPACTFTAPEGYHFLGWALTADGAVITEATITVTADITLYAKWEIDHVANNVTIHFTNAFRWANVKAYVFNNITHVEKTAFPGEAMTRVGVNSQYQAVYSYTVDISLYTEIVFTNGESGDSNQTVDIDISSANNSTSFYLKGHVDDDDSKKATVGEYIYEDALLIDESELYFFTNNNNWPQIHAYRFNSITSAEKTTWGDAPVMTYLCNNEYGQGIYVIRIDDLDDYNAIIFRDTANHQTVDIILDSAEFAGHNAFYLNGEMSGGSYQVAATDDNYVIY